MERNKIFNIHHFDTDDELQKICFDIKKYEFDNDEVFSGHSYKLLLCTYSYLNSFNLIL